MCVLRISSHYIILLSKKMTSQKEIDDIITVPYQIPSPSTQALGWPQTGFGAPTQKAHEHLQKRPSQRREMSQRLVNGILVLNTMADGLFLGAPFCQTSSPMSCVKSTLR